MLQHDTECLTREPTGVGLDVPAWLVALEEEVEDVLHLGRSGEGEVDFATAIPLTLVTYEEARQQLEEWASRQTSA
jgi:hypothetical protein